jgi:hypothetical protein
MERRTSNATIPESGGTKLTSSRTRQGSSTVEPRTYQTACVSWAAMPAPRLTKIRATPEAQPSGRAAGEQEGQGHRSHPLQGGRERAGVGQAVGLLDPGLHVDGDGGGP